MSKKTTKKRNKKKRARAPKASAVRQAPPSLPSSVLLAYEIMETHKQLVGVSNELMLYRKALKKVGEKDPGMLEAFNAAFQEFAEAAGYKPEEVEQVAKPKEPDVETEELTDDIAEDISVDRAAREQFERLRNVAPARTEQDVRDDAEMSSNR